MKAECKVLSVFDFDGTLTYWDSFILFLYFAFGIRHFAKNMIYMMLPTLYYVKNKLTRDELKEALIRAFLSNIDERWLRQKADDFCNKYWKRLMRPAGISAVITELNSGAEVTICSASPAIILQPFADKLGINLIGTLLQIKNNNLTGNIDGHNCRCYQKILRLKQEYGDLRNYHLRAWGDSCGDYDLLKLAQESHWKYFHKI